MPVIISKDNLPNVQYNMVKRNDGTVMMAVVQTGVILIFVERYENLFVPWEEIVEFAAMSQDKVPVEPVTQEVPAQENPLGVNRKSGAREIKKQ